MQLSLTGSAWPWHASCSHSISVFDDGLWLEIEVRSTDEAAFLPAPGGIRGSDATFVPGTMFACRLTPIGCMNSTR